MVYNSKYYKLFLDDVRMPDSIYFGIEPTHEPRHITQWITVENFDNAVKIVQNRGCPMFVSFDHDLGEGKNGHDFAKWLVEQDLDNPGFFPEDFSYHVHSGNVVGICNIEGLLDNYFKNKK